MVFLVVAGILLATVVAVWFLQRGNADGPRVTASLGDGLGNVIDVFHPSGARANRDLKEQQNVGPVTPTPDPDPDDPVLIERGPDGIPRKVRIRRNR